MGLVGIQKERSGVKNPQSKMARRMIREIRMTYGLTHPARGNTNRYRNSNNTYLHWKDQRSRYSPTAERAVLDIRTKVDLIFEAFLGKT